MYVCLFQQAHSTPKNAKLHSRVLHVDTKLEHDVSPIIHPEIISTTNNNTAVTKVTNPTSASGKSRKSSGSRTRNNGVISPPQNSKAVGSSTSVGSNGVTSAVHLQSDSNSSITQVTPLASSGAEHSDCNITVGEMIMLPHHSRIVFNLVSLDCFTSFLTFLCYVTLQKKNRSLFSEFDQNHLSLILECYKLTNPK